MTLRLTNTKAALEHYRATEPARDAILDAATTSQAVNQWCHERAKAIAAVREAFYQDTRDLNSWDRCQIVDLAWLTEQVKKYG